MKARSRAAGDSSRSPRLTRALGPFPGCARRTYPVQTACIRKAARMRVNGAHGQHGVGPGPWARGAALSREAGFAKSGSFPDSSHSCRVQRIRTQSPCCSMLRGAPRSAIIETTKKRTKLHCSYLSYVSSRCPHHCGDRRMPSDVNQMVAPKAKTFIERDVFRFG